LNKQKIINDPVHGFITIPGDNVFRIIEHPYFQRLRRIRQLGLTHMVYPGAMHTRFLHSLGALHLMQQAIISLQHKGQEILPEEETALYFGILLHDVGHGPFSHALEHSIVSGVHHEDISLAFMQELDVCFKGELKTAISIFKDSYKKKYFHQLIAGQLDMDRLDYLKRDSFYCGVAEGIINEDRIIKTLNVHDNKLAIEAKGIYSVEKFLIARRLMYWQVYLHKTVIASEYLLMNILKRAKYLERNGADLFATAPLKRFLGEEYFKDDFLNNSELLNTFAGLDDFDIISAVKAWTNHKDNILADLCKRLVNRNLYKIEMKPGEFSQEYVDAITEKTRNLLNLEDHEAGYYAFRDTTSNYAYDPMITGIDILFKDGRIEELSKASDLLNLSVLAQPVLKHFLCYPKEVAVVKK
jgi:HD superfamily phosphohydrolase